MSLSKPMPIKPTRGATSYKDVAPLVSLLGRFLCRLVTIDNDQKNVSTMKNEILV